MNPPGNLGNWLSRFDSIRSKLPQPPSWLTKPVVPEFLDADVIFICAACKERVGRYRKDHERRKWQVPSDFTCSQHGPLRDDIDYDELWAARGKPERMTVRLRPQRRGGSR